MSKKLKNRYFIFIIKIFWTIFTKQTLCYSSQSLVSKRQKIFYQIQGQLMLRKMFRPFLSMECDLGDCFPFEFELNGIQFGLKSKEKQSPRSYFIQLERNWNICFGLCSSEHFPPQTFPTRTISTQRIPTLDTFPGNISKCKGYLQDMYSINILVWNIQDSLRVLQNSSNMQIKAKKICADSWAISLRENILTTLHIYIYIIYICI